jgi:DNA gyrase subunit A
MAELKSILDSKTKRMEIIKDELLEIKEKYGEERRTEIIDKATDLNIEDMIKEEDMVLTITHNQYIKRTSVSTYKSQRRGGRGVQGQTAREEDFTEHLFVENTHSYILFFTDKGKCYWVKVYDIPEGGRAAKGRAIVNLIGCEPDEKVSAFIGVKQDQFHDDHFVVMATEKGIVKKTKLSAYSNPRKKGIYAVEIRDGDSLIEARVSNGENDILLGTTNGKSIRFSEEQIRPSGRKTMGVKGITLSSSDDKVVGMLLIKREGTVLVATENGFGKRTEIIQYRAQKRGGKGVLTMKTTDKIGKMITIKEVVGTDDLMIIRDDGVLIRMPVSQIRSIGRATQGVKLIKLAEGTKVSAITRIISEEEKTTDEPKDSPESQES